MPHQRLRQDSETRPRLQPGDESTMLHRRLRQDSKTRLRLQPNDESAMMHRGIRQDSETRLRPQPSDESAMQHQHLHQDSETRSRPQPETDTATKHPHLPLVYFHCCARLLHARLLRRFDVKCRCESKTQLLHTYGSVQPQDWARAEDASVCITWATIELLGDPWRVCAFCWCPRNHCREASPGHHSGSKMYQLNPDLVPTSTASPLAMTTRQYTFRPMVQSSVPQTCHE